MKRNLFASLVACLLATTATAQAPHQFTINTKPGAEVQPTMYGIFFEDINFGADGGLYAELVSNRSFEAPLHITPAGERLSGGFLDWKTFGNVQLNSENPAFSRNPHYVTLNDDGHREKQTGIENHGYFGMGMKQGMKYNFSVFGRARNADNARIRVELVGNDNEVMARQAVDINGKDWKKVTAQLTAPRTDAKAFLRIYLEGKNSVDLDHVSLFPEDAWQGILRADMVQDLKDLHPGVFRFPGGCIVEGTDLASRYQWKETVGQVENRPLNENRWNYTFAHRLFPSYFQSYGLGFYEFFLLSEYIGAQALPVLNVGLACQYQNSDHDAARVHVAVDNLQPYIDDALDLIEFANGSTDTKWGKLRAEMGHPEPFNLKQIGVGNEQWGPLYPERLEKFVAAIRAKYPTMKIVGSSGPDPDDKGNKQFTYGWEQMTRLKADLVDEHYYRNQDWFINNVARYDSYDRKGPKVFAGEYACHVKEGPQPTAEGMNVFDAALYEAAAMTGFERNADIVHMATYAPLFAHVEGWQWRPDLIWVDNLTTVRTPNYYVQQLYAMNPGTNVLSLTEEVKKEGEKKAKAQPVTGQDGLCASAVFDKASGKYIVKVVNVGDQPQTITLTFKGLKEMPAKESVQLITLHSDNLMACNTIQNKHVVTPVEQKNFDLTIDKNTATIKVPAKTFAVYKF
ncbi:MAG: carbohydrate binding domain-containing protein [Prevotella sp.]|nr:carbohydrate binding domain-containing protein [Prevotella sp.]